MPTSLCSSLTQRKSEPIDAIDPDSLLGLVDKARGVSSRDDFTRYLVNDAIVPFESSPLETKALIEIASSAGATAALGYFASEHPLILLTLPAGIVICGAAIGVGEALQQGLRAKILKLMGIRDPSKSDDEQLTALRMLTFLASAALRQDPKSKVVGTDASELDDRKTDEDHAPGPPDLTV